MIKRLRGCGAGCEYVAITPDGDIYPCHQFVGKEEYRMGNVFDGSFDMDISGTFAQQNIYTRRPAGSAGPVSIAAAAVPHLTCLSMAT